ncbi:MAG TPA: ATP-binding protein [Acidimicrobiia bacterium]|nr:ATP-binding protein [Acidimicrobiia bacterium]
MTIPSINELRSTRAAMAASRGRVVKLALRAGWLMLAGFLFASWRIGEIGDIRAWAPLAAIAVVLAALAIPNWELTLRRGSGDLLLILGVITIGSAMSIMATIPAFASFVLIGYFGVVALMAALSHWVVPLVTALVLIATNFIARAAFDRLPTAEDIVVPTITLVVVAIATAAITNELRREIGVGIRRQQELEARERDLERLYEVSRTLAAGDSLTRVLPELVGKIATHLQAEVGVVLLHDRDRAALEVVSPIWAAGHTLEVNGYLLPLRRRGDIEQTFVSGQARRFGQSDANTANHLLNELGVEHALAVPLKVENRTMGVMMVADRTDGAPFTDEDLEVLTSLSAPAALVLAHLGRFEEAAETGRRMEELAQLKSDFVSVVSHELRTPLTSIIGSLDTIARPELAPQSSSALSLLDSARNQAARLRLLIENLLMTSRIDNQALPQHPAEIDLEPFIRGVIEEIPEAPEHVALRVAGSISLRVDPDHLGRVVINLVQNALKYAPGAPIELSAVVAADRIEISVVDHGPGISPDMRAKVFEPFTQLEPAATRSRSGTGLGLAIVKGLAESMGGSVRLEETPGGGATFVVDLPLRPRSVPRSSDHGELDYSRSPAATE